MRVGYAVTLARSVLPVLWLSASASAFAFDTRKLGQFGSLGVDELKEVIDQSPQLKQEVEEAVAKLGKKPEEIRCTGARFPGAWVGLSGNASLALRLPVRRPLA